MVPRLPLHLLPHRRGRLHGRRHPGLPLARRHVRLAAARAADGHGDAAADDAGGSGARGHQGEGLGNGWEMVEELRVRTFLGRVGRRVRWILPGSFRMM